MRFDIGDIVYEQYMITNTKREGTKYKTSLYRIVNMKDPNNFRCYDFSTNLDCMVGSKRLKPFWLQHNEFVEILLGSQWTKARAVNFLQNHDGLIQVTFESFTMRTITIPEEEFSQRVRIIDKEISEF